MTYSDSLSPIFSIRLYSGVQDDPLFVTNSERAPELLHLNKEDRIDVKGKSWIVKERQWDLDYEVLTIFVTSE